MAMAWSTTMVIKSSLKNKFNSIYFFNSRVCNDTDGAQLVFALRSGFPFEACELIFLLSTSSINSECEIKKNNFKILLTQKKNSLYRTQ